jgi:hypothetical protein
MLTKRRVGGSHFFAAYDGNVRGAHVQILRSCWRGRMPRNGGGGCICLSKRFSFGTDFDEIWYLWFYTKICQVHIVLVIPGQIQSDHKVLLHLLLSAMPVKLPTFWGFAIYSI